jgi:hypothetical protein
MTTCRRIRRAIPGCRNSPAEIRYNAFRWCFPPIFPRQVPRLTSFHSPARTHKRWSLSPRSRFPAFSAAGRAKWARTRARSSSGKLIATGGERLQHDGYSEISAICTHPSFRGPSASFGTWCAIIVATACSRDSTQAAPIIARSDCISEWGSSRSAKSLYIAYLARLSELALRF